MRATGEQVAAALKDYAEETGSLRITRFVRARAGSDGYGKHLGLVSTIRKDFDQLESLMLDRGPKNKEPQHLKEAREHHESRVKVLLDEAEKEKTLEEDEIQRIKATTGSMPKADLEAMEFHRIVLYIDDLDRCEPAKVVEVLQAVNMLLTFRLFVVMVAVDARWLARSLEKQYPEFFGAADWHEDAPVTGRGSRRATTADYLEKIFQIPYWVPEMASETSKTLVSELMTADAQRTGTGAVVVPSPTPPMLPMPVPTGQLAQAQQAGSAPVAEDEQPMAAEPPAEALHLTEAEAVAIASLAPCLGGSPRRARRFVNVYRVAKASLAPEEVERLEKDGHKALATQLAIATGAPNAFAAWVEICRSADHFSIGQRIAAIEANDEERRNIEEALATFRKMSTDTADVMKRLAEQASLAGRFSFATPIKTGVPRPPPILPPPPPPPSPRQPEGPYALGPAFPPSELPS